MSVPKLDHDKVKRYADKIMVMIREDAREGVHPYTVRTFSALHDRCDANMYFEHAGQVFDGSDYSIAEINAVQDEVQRRLMAGELSGGEFYQVTWNVTEQHQATFTVNQLRDLFQIAPDAPVDVDALADRDETIQALEASGGTWHGDVGREVVTIEQQPDRQLSEDEVSAVGLDYTGQDARTAFSHRWSSLTDEMRNVLCLLGGSQTRAAERFTDQQAEVARLTAVARRGSSSPEDVSDCGTRFAETKTAALAHGPDGVADVAAHDAAVELPDDKPVAAALIEPERGSLEWAERVMRGGTPAMQAIRRAAAHVVVLALAEVADNLGNTATSEAVVKGVAHSVLPRQAMLDLIAAVREMRQLDAQYSQLVDEGNESGHENEQDMVNEQANDRARDALNSALQLLGVTE